MPKLIGSMDRIQHKIKKSLNSGLLSRNSLKLKGRQDGRELIMTISGRGSLMLTTIIQILLIWPRNLLKP